MRHACLLVTLLLVASLPVSSSSNSPPVEVDVSTTKFDWLSNETVELSVEVLNSQFNQQYYANYTVTDLAGNIVQTGSYNFVSSGPNTQFPVLLSQLYNNSNFYFVYLPRYSRYVKNLDNKSYKNVKKILKEPP